MHSILCIIFLSCVAATSAAMDFIRNNYTVHLLGVVADGVSTHFRITFYLEDLSGLENIFLGNTVVYFVSFMGMMIYLLNRLDGRKWIKDVNKASVTSLDGLLPVSSLPTASKIRRNKMKLNGVHRTFMGRYIIWMFTFFVLIQVATGLEHCVGWTELIAAGDYAVPAPGCKMKMKIDVRVEVIISGEINFYHELQSNRVDKLGEPATYNHRHFLLSSNGKLTLNYLKLTWGEAGTTGIINDGGCIKMNDGILAINFVHFDGSKTTGANAYRGGCLYIADGIVTIKESTFEGFSAEHGGAIYVAKTTINIPMTIESTTFENNVATVRFV
jgi:hypothetical protein